MAPCNSDIYNSAAEKVSFLLDAHWGQRERSAEMSHYTFFYIFRDALINNSFNLQYAIITPPPLYEVTDSEEIKLSFPPQKGLNGGPRELGRNHLHEKEILFLHW